MRPLPDPIEAGQESVWDYPRPPALEVEARRIEVSFAGVKIIDTIGAIRVLETSHPPVYYIPQGDIAPGVLRPAVGGSFCEWKGRAIYHDIVVGEHRAPRVGWSYPSPTMRFARIRDHVALYAGPMDACSVGAALVTPQPGQFYGGWITSWVVGPFKGEPGSMGW